LLSFAGILLHRYFVRLLHLLQRRRRRYSATDNKPTAVI